MLWGTRSLFIQQWKGADRFVHVSRILCVYIHYRTDSHVICGNRVCLYVLQLQQLRVTVRFTQCIDVVITNLMVLVSTDH